MFFFFFFFFFWLGVGVGWGGWGSSIFPRKYDLTFHANCLPWRKFAWSVRSYFLGTSLSSAEFAHSMIFGNNQNYEINTGTQGYDFSSCHLNFCDPVRNDVHDPLNLLSLITLASLWKIPYSTYLLHCVLRFFKNTEKTCGKICTYLYLGCTLKNIKWGLCDVFVFCCCFFFPRFSLSKHMLLALIWIASTSRCNSNGYQQHVSFLRSRQKYTGCNLKTMELFDCAFIRVCAVIRSNTVSRGGSRRIISDGDGGGGGGGGGGGVCFITLPYLLHDFGQTCLSKQFRPRTDAVVKIGTLYQQIHFTTSEYV